MPGLLSHLTEVGMGDYNQYLYKIATKFNKNKHLSKNIGQNINY